MGSFIIRCALRLHGIPQQRDVTLGPPHEGSERDGERGMQGCNGKHMPASVRRIPRDRLGAAHGRSRGLGYSQKALRKHTSTGRCRTCHLFCLSPASSSAGFRL